MKAFDKKWKLWHQMKDLTRRWLNLTSKENLFAKMKENFEKK
jgi:hypothetical protein